MILTLPLSILGFVTLGLLALATRSATARR
jgi:hypothetical protein